MSQKAVFQGISTHSKACAEPECEFCILAPKVTIFKGKIKYKFHTSLMMQRYHF
jgi:hypothetical protein